MEINTVLFGARLRKYRKSMGWTQNEASENCHLCLNYYGEIERGHRVPSMDTFLSLCEQMDCYFGDFINNEKEAHADSSIDENAILYIAEINTILKESTPEQIKAYLDIIKIFKDSSNKK